MSDKKFYDAATLAFKKIDANAGDLVVIRFPDDIAHEQMQRVGYGLADYAAEKGIDILCLREGVSVEHVDEARMNELGWFRFDKDKMN